MRIAVIDSGARGHALINAYMKSMREHHEDFEGRIIGSNCERLEHKVDLKDPVKVLKTIEVFEPDLVDVANDDCLAYGLVDTLTEKGYRVFGPTKEAARIEWDKRWARELIGLAGIPNPIYRSFRKGEESEAESFAYYLLNDITKRVFFKASGLCAGKGVESASKREDVPLALAKIKGKGHAADTFLVEEGLEGEEFSYFAITDGKDTRFFRSAQDNKLQFDGDKGDTTGGMGAHSPALVTRGLESKIKNQIIRPVIETLGKERRKYTGILYFGGIVTPEREVRIIEFNARWGDPECLVILPGIKTNYFDLVSKAIDGRLSEIKLREDNLSRIAIVAASKGYPKKYKLGRKITIDYSKLRDDVEMVPAAIIQNNNGGYYTNGGRLFDIVTEDFDLRVARKRALNVMSAYSIGKDGLYYRRDIGIRDIRRLNRQS